MDLENDKSKPSVSNNVPTLKQAKRDSTSPSSIHVSSSRDARMQVDREKKETLGRRCMTYLYNRDYKTLCGRTCKSWLLITTYSIIYLVFLATYTLIFLYGTLFIMKYTIDYQSMDKAELLTYSVKGVGLSLTPSPSETNYPIISYRNGEDSDFGKYIIAIERFLKDKNRKREIGELGPCGKPPYGYGEAPCVIIRINKQWKWAGRPLQINSTKIKEAPMQVQEWIKSDRKLWLQCNGYHSYDKEHIGDIKYYPDPPGFDHEIFPLNATSVSPIIAVQISNFSLGISLAVECKLWYEDDVSRVEFMLHVTPGYR